MKYFKEGELVKQAEREKAAVFVEALPYIQKFRGKKIVVKIGGGILENPDLKKKVIKDIVTLYFVGLSPIIVHGGGVQIDNVLEKMGKEPHFVDGKRVTDDDTMEVVQMVLAGMVNKDLVSSISQQGAEAIGISGQDGRFITVSPLDAQNGVDYGRVGKIDKLNVAFLERIHSSRVIPVIASVGVDAHGQAFNVNADEVAEKIAIDLCVEKLIFISNVDGVYHSDNGEEKKKLIKTMNVAELEEIMNVGKPKKLKKDQQITEGMIVKLQSIKEALKEGVASVQIISGKKEHGLLLELFTDSGVGTQIVP